MACSAAFAPLSCSVQLLHFQVEEQTQFGIISSKGSYTFFKRGLPVESKSIYLSEAFDCSAAVRSLFLYMLHAAVTADPMPCGKHADIPGKSKLIRSDGSISTFVPTLKGISTAAFRQQASAKRSFQDREDRGELELADSKQHLSLHDSNRLTSQCCQTCLSLKQLPWGCLHCLPLGRCICSITLR